MGTAENRAQADDGFADRLETMGWRRDVAGPDFDLGCRIARAVFKGPRAMEGLVLSGKYGSGKTAFVKALFPHADFYAMPTQETILDPDYFPAESRTVVLDDVGAEHDVNEYGVRKDAFADFVVRWHSRMLGRARLVITTNLSIRDFERRYGGRVVSRLKDICVAARLSGGDKREWTVIR